MKRIYKDNYLENIAYPLGGIGAGMLCIEGTGSFGSVSLRHKPDLFNEPYMYAALAVKGSKSRLLEGSVVNHKIWGGMVNGFFGAGNGMTSKSYGLPRFRSCSFSSQFPFAWVKLEDCKMPVSCGIQAFSPFIPGNEDVSSLPCAAVTYSFSNPTAEGQECVFYFSALQFMGDEGGGDKLYTRQTENGFVFCQEKTEKQGSEGYFSVQCAEAAQTDTDLYRGTWLAQQDTMTIMWNRIDAGLYRNAHASDNRSPGATIAVPFTLGPGESREITLRFCWYVPESDVQIGENAGFYRPWYASRYKNINQLSEDFTARYGELYEKTMAFSMAFAETDLPDIVCEAAEANLSILKSPTVLRQHDGRFWGWEGVCDTFGSCHGSCSHVWNYAQAMCSLFPALERTLRETEFNEDQDENGHQQFRTLLPIRPNSHEFYAASDGQPGGIMKAFREWRISGSDEWLKKLWPRILTCMDYCIRQWDPEEQGVLTEPHHNTYDIEFWGADSMCSSFYLGALRAVYEMGSYLGENTDRYQSLYEKGRHYVETELWNGEYFIQKTDWTGLNAVFDAGGDPLLMEMGPKYQYGTGCISDGLCGAWLAKCCGLGDIFDREKTISHLKSVYKYNLRHELFDHANPQRPGYALGKDGGLLLCSWPRGEKPQIPFPYSDEVWTGIEYQVASHMAMMGMREEALDIVETARKRYDGERRSPYDEYECGHWYARALASYSLLSAFTGVSYDHKTRTLYYGSRDARVFLSTATGFGVAEISGGKCTVRTVSGTIPVDSYVLTE